MALSKHPFICGFLLVTLVFALNGCMTSPNKSNPNECGGDVRYSYGVVINCFIAPPPSVTPAAFVKDAGEMVDGLLKLVPTGMGGADQRGWWRRALHIGDAKATPLPPADESVFETMTPEEASE